jgi:dTDP-4-amino-4,6-dideoxygalactose transaminase
VITYTPLPKIKDVFSIEARPKIDTMESTKIWCKEGSYAYLFSRSTWSILSVVKWIKIAKDCCIPIIWVPDYFCNSVLSPIRKEGVTIIFYPISENLEPDWDKCQKLLKTSKPDLFIIVHYFGIPSDLNKAGVFCQANNSALLEDATHVLYPNNGIGEVGHFVIFSQHKVLAIPDGASLVLNVKKIKRWTGLSRSNIITSFNKVSRSLPDDSPKTRNWILKRVLQKLIPVNILNVFAVKENTFPSNKTFSSYSFQPRISSLGIRLMKMNSEMLEGYASTRQEVARSLSSFFRTKNIVNQWENRINGAILYSYPLKTKTSKDAKDVYNWLKRNTIPVSSWPDLPPEVTDNKEFHEAAINLHNTVVLVPNHQSINSNRLGKALKVDPIIDLDPYEYKFCWNNVTISSWNNIFNSITKSNLLQSWNYGEAKAKTQGWKIHRSIIYNKAKPIGLVQVLIKKYPIVGSIARINRGPIFFSEISYEYKIQVYELLKSELSAMNIKKIFIAPELPNYKHIRKYLKIIGYKDIAKRKWHSSWIDLHQSVGLLRESLNGKWRNQLKSSEKSDLSIRITTDKDDFEWLMNRYIEFQEEKKFSGIPVSTLRTLFSLDIEHQEVYISVAYNYNIPIAGTITVRHGLACTYLVGWSNQKGRSLYATNYLLFNTIIEMKELGCKYFDLGGMNEKGLQEITRFKRGLSGNEYMLAGEFVKWSF